MGNRIDRTVMPLLVTRHRRPSDSVRSWTSELFNYLSIFPYHLFSGEFVFGTIYDVGIFVKFPMNFIILKAELICFSSSNEAFL